MQAFKKFVGCVAPEPTDVSYIEPAALINKSHFITAGVLGEGGFGKVMTGTCTKNSEWYAIKEIDKANLLKHKTGVSMLLGEIQAMKRVDHPAVINLHFSFHDKRKCFLVMDLKTGGDLRYYLRKRYLFEEVDVAFYVACLSSALDHMHNHGIIHRDVKPENILLDERGYPYLTDFGVAHVQNENDFTLTSYLASGTRQYLAPEVFTKTHIHGPEMDYWSLAVVAYELLFGRRPFDKHCPIVMINYLERALSAKRRFTKEMQMRRMSGLSGTSKSMDFCATSPAAIARTSIDFGTCSSPAMSHSHSVLSQSQDSPMRPRQSLNTRPSSEVTTAERGSLVYCSSVGYSRSNISSKSEDGHTSEGRSSFALTGSPQLEDGELSSCTSPSSKPNSPPALKSSRSPARHKLPSLRAAALGSPPRPEVFQQKGNGSVPAPFPLPSEGFGEKIGLLPLTMDKPELTSEDSEDSISDVDDRSSLSPRKYAPGNHWLVDEGRLPGQLRVPIPKLNPWLGELSDECLQALRGLFEIRPSHRLGARNMDALRNQPWFLEFGDWDALLTQTYQPHFQPGKRFMREVLESMGNVMQAHFLGENDHTSETDMCDLAAAITPEQEEQFNEGFYIAPKLRPLFHADTARSTKYQN